MLNRLILTIAAVVAMMGFTACDNSTSYAELLDEENFAVNRYLADQRVVPYVPADSVFEVGPNAPYYQLDEEGNIYMQVLNAGWGEKVEADQLVYFRFTRYNLKYYDTEDGMKGEGNETQLAVGSTSFRFGNYHLQSSYQYGTGVQMPLLYLPLNCEVNLVIKSQYGWTEEISYVQPYLYHLRYYKSQL